MAEKITFSENKLFLESKTIPFKHKIQQIIEINLRVFVLLDIPNGVENSQNIYALTKTGDLVWIVQHVSEINKQVTHFSPFVGISLKENGNLNATNFFGIAYEVSSKNGHLLSSQVSR